MRVLWFTNIPMPAVDRRTGKPTTGSGHWMSALLAALRSRPDVELGVATAYPGLPDLDFSEDSVRYFVVGQPRFRSHLGHGPGELAACGGLVDRFRPDIIHVHGSERFYGLLSARHLTSVPVVVSLQGFITACLPVFFGGMRSSEILRVDRLAELATGRGLLWGARDYAKGAEQEREILEGAKAFLGRTRWDRAQVERFNPGAAYFHVDELLRPEFSAEQWASQGCTRGRIFVTNAGNPRRGVESILEAVRTLRNRRDVELHIAGGLASRTGYGRFLLGRIARLGLSDHVHLRGYLDGPTLSRELLGSNVYVTASYVENSPNSLCEAMSLGLPCVASYAGGIPSLLEEGRTGLFFPPGDAALLAQRLEEVLSDDALATRLGAAARRVALERHAPARVVGQLLDAYRAVASGQASRSPGESA